MSEFTFKNIKTPGWVLNKEFCIYFKVIRNNEEIGYIGLQELDHSVGLCNNLAIKTFEEFRGEGLTKQYLKEFIENGPLRFDCIRAKVDRDNIASQKVFEYAGFEKRGIRKDEEGEPTKFGYTWKKF